MNLPQSDSPTMRVPYAAPRRRLKAILTLLGIGLLAGMIAWAGPLALWQRLRMIDPGSLVAAAFVIATATVVGAINSYLICGASRVIGFAGYLRTFWVAWAIGLIFPGQVGDMLTLTHVLRRRGMPLAESVARTSIDKLISLICTLLVASQIYRLRDVAATRYLSMGAGLLALGIVIFIAISLWILHHVDRQRFRNRWISGAIAAAAEVARTVLTRPWIVVLDFVLSLIKIGLTGTAYWLVVRALIPAAPSLQQVTIAAVSSGLVAYLPLSANGIGTVEMAGAGLFGEIGLGLATVLSMYIVLRLVNILLAWIPAVFLLPELLRHGAAHPEVH